MKLNKNKSVEIGIITFHSALNCGSVLQAYALQQVISNKYKIINEIIDFSNRGQKRFYATLFVPKTVKELIRILLNVVFYKKFKNNKNEFKEFNTKYLLTSNYSYENIYELKDIESKYSILICGSDQIWNISCLDADDAYFLNFSSTAKKIAYAVSMGATNILGKGSDIENKYRKYLMDFDAISVREYNAKRWLEQLSDLNIAITADPTLLLSKVEWENLACEPLCNTGYIFWYSMTYTKNDINSVLMIAKKLGLPVYVIDPKEWTRRGLFKYGIHLSKKGGPSAFLSLMKNASLVITSSFHGTVFSTVFEKKFWYLRVNSKNTGDDRASFLLKQLGLLNRYVTSDELSEQDILGEINYASVACIIEDLQCKSYSFLSKALDK